MCMPMHFVIFLLNEYWLIDWSIDRLQYLVTVSNVKVGLVQKGWVSFSQYFRWKVEGDHPQQPLLE